MITTTWFKQCGRFSGSISLLLLLSPWTFAQDYPDMVGTWSGPVRIVEAGISGVAKGGMMVSDVEVKVIIEHQDGESFLGSTRNSQMASNQPSNRVWGTIRSDGTEAIFITSAGARGQLWFASDKQFEFCITNLQEEQATAYCAKLKKAD